MRDSRRKEGKVFLAVSVLATLFVLAETVMQFFGKSICYTEGCKVVSQQVRFGEMSILLIGLATFALLSLLAALVRYMVSPGLKRFINFILVVSLASEGFFTGYQVFAVRTPCVFCLIVLSFIVLLGIIRFFSGEREVIAGFASFAAVFAMFYLVLPVSSNVSLPENERQILFYSSECKHCAEVMRYIEENKLTVKHFDVGGYYQALKGIGIDAVPTLYVNDKYQRVFITGEDAIKRYLAACNRPPQQTPAPANEKAKPKSGKAGKGKAEIQSKTDGPALAPDIFGQHSIIPLGEPPAENGACKESEICK